MIIQSALSTLAVAALLALSPLDNVEAMSGKTASTARSWVPTAAYRGPPVIRDRRATPQPWSLPRHWHHHGDRRR